MNTTYFSVFDKKARGFGQPFPSATYGAAERSLQQSIKSPDTMLHQYPDDFALYAVFEFDDESGLVTKRFEPPQLVVEASALV